MRALWTITTLAMVLLGGYVAWRLALRREVPVEAELPRYERLAELVLADADAEGWRRTSPVMPEEARLLMQRLGVEHVAHAEPLVLCGAHDECVYLYRFARPGAAACGRPLGNSRLGGTWRAVPRAGQGGCR